MNIKNPSRILCLGSPDCNALQVVRELTGTAPTLPQTGSTAGLTHYWHVETAYYTATVPIWLDELPNIAAWEDEFLTPEAKQVVDAVGAWLLCFKTDNEQTSAEAFERQVKAIHSVIQHHDRSEADVVLLAIVTSGDDHTLNEDKQSQLEDITIQFGFELIDYAATGVNDYGEKQGIARIKEALEAHEWTLNDEAGDLLDDDFDTDQPNELEDDNELLEGLLKDKDIFDFDVGEISAQTDAEQEASSVDNLEAMLGKLLAVREQSTNLPLQQRKRVAARAVREIMKHDTS